MKKLALFCTLVTLFSANMVIATDSESLKIKCSVSANYIPLKLTFELTNEMRFYDAAEEEKRGTVEFGWSLTECEDNTEFVFLKKDFDALVSGEKEFVDASVKHDEPDIQFEAAATCKLLK